MACHRTTIFLVLLSTAAIAAELPPHRINVEDHNEFYGSNNLNLFDLNADLVKESFIIAAFVGAEVNPEEYLIAVDGELTSEINGLDESKLVKNQEANNEENENKEKSEVIYTLEMRDNNKVACDFIASPRVSCYSCYTYIDCKSSGQGKIKQCSSPYAPYCNEGLCSATPTAECDPNPESEDLEEGSGESILN